MKVESELLIDNNLVITLLRTGDEKHFDKVYHLYFKGLCAFASQYVSLDEAMEIVQDTMMWLWESREKLIPEMSLKSLLFTIVKNKALNQITHIQTKNRIHQEIIDKYKETFDDPDFYLENELMTLFNNAINQLPKEFRTAFELNRINGLTHKEIAERLNVSPQTVNYRICQALKSLRISLKDYLPVLF